MKLNPIFVQYLKEDLSFDYRSIEKSIWYKLIKEAMDKFKISFDLENCDPISTVREYNNNDYKFLYQSCKAGGDWQSPTIFYKCQLLSGYVKSLSYTDKNNGCFVFIPNKEQGNLNLVLDSKGKYLVPEDDGKNVPKSDEKKCLQSLKIYLDSLSRK